MARPMETLPSKCPNSSETNKDSLWSKIKNFLNNFSTTLKKRNLPDNDLNLKHAHSMNCTLKWENDLIEEGLANKRRKINDKIYENSQKEGNQLSAIPNKKLENKLTLKAQKKPKCEPFIVNDFLGLFKPPAKSEDIPSFSNDIFYSNNLINAKSCLEYSKSSKLYNQRKANNCVTNLNEFFEKKREKDRNYFKYKIRMNSPPKANKINVRKSNFTLSSSSLDIIIKPIETNCNSTKNFSNFSPSADIMESNCENLIQSREEKQIEKTPPIQKPEIQTNCNSNASNSLGTKLDLQNNLDHDDLSKQDKSDLSDLLVTEKVCEFRMTDECTDVNTEANTYNQCNSNENTFPNITEENTANTSLTKNTMDQHQKESELCLSKLKNNLSKCSDENPFLAKMNQSIIPISSLFSHFSNNNTDNKSDSFLFQNNVMKNQIIQPSTQYKINSVESTPLFGHNSLISNMASQPIQVNDQNNNMNQFQIKMLPVINPSFPNQSFNSQSTFQNNEKILNQNKTSYCQNYVLNSEHLNINKDLQLNNCLPKPVQDDSQYFTMGTTKKKGK